MKNYAYVCTRCKVEIDKKFVEKEGHWDFSMGVRWFCRSKVKKVSLKNCMVKK